MKSFTLAFAMFLYSFIIIAQEECKDIIYPTDGESMIFNCCIYEVKNGNMVYYTREGDSAMVAAVAITKDGQYIDLKKYKSQLDDKGSPVINQDGLYKGYDYHYYNEIYKRASAQRGAGIFLTILGFGIEIAGFLSISNESSTDGNKEAGSILIVVGSIFETIGIPLWISGGVKRANNRRAIEEINRKMNLSFGATRNGVGLKLNF